jgi:hypothetical protein
MRLSVRFSLAFAAAGFAALLASPCLHAQDQGSSSQQGVATPLTAPAYIVVDPLAGVRYDNRFDVSLGAAYDHMKAGPNLLQGSNLGGLDASGSYWFARRWAAEGSFRAYLGTSGAAPNTASINGPFVAQYLFVGGPEWLGPHNKHGALIAHALFGGTKGVFEKDLRGNSPEVVGFYNDQIAPAAIIGGHMDLNRSAHWVFRITPDAVITRYHTDYGSKITQTDVNFAISVGIEYKFKKKR